METIGWIVVLIGIMAAVSKFLNKEKKRSNRQTLRHPQMFQKNQLNGLKPESNVVGGPDEYHESSKAVNNTGKENAYNRNQYTPYSRDNDVPYGRENVGVYQREKSEPNQKRRKHESYPFRHLTKKQLREGIVLAEALSEKPRARNPHPAASLYRQRTKG